MSLYEKILVTSDLTEASEPALRMALELVRRTGARLTALHVSVPAFHPRPLWAPLTDSEPLLAGIAERVREAAERALDEQVRKLAGELAVEVTAVIGVPSDVICQTAQSLGAGLIVMGTHGRRGLAHMALGSVAEHVVREAVCPVLTVRV